MTRSEDEGWLDARERDEPVDHVDAATRARYEALQRQIAGLPELTPPDGWQARILERVQRDHLRARGRQWLALAAGTLAAAAVAILVFVVHRPVGEPSLEILVGTGGARRGAEMLAVHDRLRVKATGVADVRLYRADGGLLASCPAGPHCVDGAVELELLLPGPHELVGFTSCQLASSSGYADDMARAKVATCTILQRSLTVR